MGSNPSPRWSFAGFDSRNHQVPLETDRASRHQNREGERISGRDEQAKSATSGAVRGRATSTSGGETTPMNALRQLWHLIRDPNETPTIKKSREVEVESYIRQYESKRIIERVNGSPVGPLLNYIRGAGKPHD